MLPLVPPVPVNLQAPTICFKCHLFEGGRCYLSTTTTGPFVPASRDTNKQRPRLLQAPPPIPTHRLGQTRSCLPDKAPQFDLSRAHGCSSDPQRDTRWVPTVRNSCQLISIFHPLTHIEFVLPPVDGQNDIILQ